MREPRGLRLDMRWIKASIEEARELAAQAHKLVASAAELKRASKGGDFSSNDMSAPEIDRRSEPR